MSVSENSVPKPLSFSASATPYPAASFGMGRIIDHPRVTPYPAARFGVFFLHFVEFIDPYCVPTRHPVSGQAHMGVSEY